MTQFGRFLHALIDGRVEFIIVGGLAATIHGSARVTKDIDIVYSRSDENIGRLVAALAPYAPYLRGAPPNLPFEWSVGTLKAGLNFTLVSTVGWIDLLGEVTGGGGYDSLRPDAVSVQLHVTGTLRLAAKADRSQTSSRPSRTTESWELETILDLQADRKNQ